jgi:hypothetical protein
MTLQRSQPSTCRDHKALKDGRMEQNRVSTGIVAAACARHGCFYPHSVVNFQAGERSD